MGNEHIGGLRDTIPVFADGGTALAPKCPLLTEDGVDRRTPEVQAFQANTGVLQIDGLGEVSAGQLRIAVEEQIVVAGDDQLVPEGKRA